MIAFAGFIVILTILNSCNGTPTVPGLCEPGLIDEMPPHIKKVCLALENSNELSSALSAYIKNEAQGRLILFNSI